MAAKPPAGARQRRRGELALIALIAGLFVGWGVILAFATATESTLTAFGVGSMVAAATMVAGAFFGFLFGVPRTLQKSADEDDGSATASGTNSQGSNYRPNTNLEQISDWLTKVLVGAGLTQISGIRQSLRDVGATLAPGFGASESGRVFATATVLYYLFDGFLIGYLWTRLYFAGALQGADLENLANKIDEIKQQNDLDARALALVLRQLNPSAGSPPPSQQELNEAIKEAAPSMKAQIFYQAGIMRSENWSEPGKKAKMERTIPVFRALIASDKDEEYHRNYGQLGYALKDQRNPDWASAEAALTKAIQIRGSAKDHHWVYYEFNRAICRINTDENFALSKTSSADNRKRIVEDLQVAMSDTDVKDIVTSEKVIKDWVALNNAGFQELEGKPA